MGDSEGDLLACRAAKVQSCAVMTGPQQWKESGSTDDYILLPDATHIIKAFSESGQLSLSTNQLNTSLSRKGRSEMP